ncbi:50S ribosomal protein L22 [Cardinium endosymbiont of Culicoides punctatus]|uniref:50S ribosomal protein L22 n=1 Tax=Cardinium endosymbiont of Culicoides punctatus TaxID=2304601 RepID=UPI001058A086|nr:50S ribosomal protein L22 [Cardinium endosymbiont of Culicoides punctatus]TDG95309.1 50S ribosomal protein L22 [Cardinium endosymbiont of Culicoides punctatus]
MEAIARLRNLSISARKISLLATLVRGKTVATALAILQNKQGQSVVPLRKLLLSAMANWQNCNEDALENTDMFIKNITVDRAGMLKRIMPASRGVAHRIRKRSSHVTIVVDGIVHTPDAVYQAIPDEKHKNTIEE